MRVVFFAAAIAASPLAVATAQAPGQPPAPAQPSALSQPPFVIPFTRGGTSVDNEMEPMLDRVIAYAQANRTMGVVITGIANPQGSDSARARRAQAMAQSIRTYLRDSGVPESRTRTAAEGDAQVGSLNRVEVTFVAR